MTNYKWTLYIFEKPTMHIIGDECLDFVRNVPVDKTPIPKFEKGDTITFTDHDNEIH